MIERRDERWVDSGRMLASGTQWRAEISKPESQIARKPAWAASLAERGEWEDMAMRGECGLMRWRSWLMVGRGIVFVIVLLCPEKVDEECATVGGHSTRGVIELAKCEIPKVQSRGIHIS